MNNNISSRETWVLHVQSCALAPAVFSLGRMKEYIYINTYTYTQSIVHIDWKQRFFAVHADFTHLERLEPLKFMLNRVMYSNSVFKQSFCSGLDWARFAELPRQAASHKNMGIGRSKRWANKREASEELWRCDLRVAFPFQLWHASSVHARAANRRATSSTWTSDFAKGKGQGSWEESENWQSLLRCINFQVTSGNKCGVCCWCHHMHHTNAWCVQHGFATVPSTPGIS